MVRRANGVGTSVRRDLRAIASVDQALAKSGLAASALVLAAELDETRTPAVGVLALQKIVEETDDENARRVAFLALEHIERRPGSSASEKAQCARALLATMDRLRELAPGKAAGKSLVDELLDRRAKRQAG